MFYIYYILYISIYINYITRALTSFNFGLIYFINVKKNVFGLIYFINVKCLTWKNITPAF